MKSEEIITTYGESLGTLLVIGVGIFIAGLCYCKKHMNDTELELSGNNQPSDDGIEL